MQQNKTEVITMQLKDKYTIEDLLEIMERLRQPDGCPWDRVQTHESIKRDMIEEAYEKCIMVNNLTRDYALKTPLETVRKFCHKRIYILFAVLSSDLCEKF